MGTLVKERSGEVPSPDGLVSGAELFRHPEWDRCELIQGKVIPMCPAGGRHGQVAGLVHFYLAQYALETGHGVVLAAETGMVLGEDPDTVRAPDAMYIRTSRIPEDGLPEGYLRFAPDLCVEVASPHDSMRELEEKAEQFLAAGVQAIWVLDPKSKVVRVYRSGKAVDVFGEHDRLVDEGILPGFSLPVRVLFASA